MSTEFPLIITVAPNGARRTKADHAAVPMTPPELAATAAACREAGAAMIHLHVRDLAGRHTLDVESYRDAIAAIRKSVGDKMVVQVTSEAVGIYHPPQQMAMVRALKPEAVSLSVREIVPDAASESEASSFFAWMKNEEIRPQFILYSPDDLARLRDLMRRGLIPWPQPFVLFVLGRYSENQRSSPADLLPFIAPMPSDVTWAVCAFGPLESGCALTAAALGGHARVGFENNLFLADGSIAPDNAALVRQLAAGVALIGRSVGDAAALRAMLS